MVDTQAIRYPSQQHVAGRWMLGHPVKHPDAKWKSWPFCRMWSLQLLSKGQQSKQSWAYELGGVGGVAQGSCQKVRAYAARTGQHGHRKGVSLQVVLFHKCCFFAQFSHSLKI